MVSRETLRLALIGLLMLGCFLVIIIENGTLETSAAFALLGGLAAYLQHPTSDA